MTIEQNAPPDAIITGEGVALELPAATTLSRIGSGLVDYGLTFVALGLVLWNLAPALQDMSAARGSVVIIFTIAVFLWIVPALVTGVMNGTSPGRALARIRVVTLDGGTITMQQSFIRATLGIIEVWLTLGMLATIVSTASKRGQRFGDMAAGTYVVRWPKKTSWEPEAAMPPSLAQWAQLAQTRPLPTGLSLNVADFLKSRGTLAPEYRDVQARALAAACERYVSPPPPWGTNPEEFLEAMTVIRYSVERRRHARITERRARLTKRVSDMPYGLSST